MIVLSCSAALSFARFVGFGFDFGTAGPGGAGTGGATGGAGTGGAEATLDRRVDRRSDMWGDGFFREDARITEVIL